MMPNEDAGRTLMTEPKLLLLDGMGIIFRAYYAFITRPLTNSRGENTSAIFGFFRILFMILKEQKPDHLIAAFDVSRDTFRRRLYPEYKAHREETPEDLKAQIPVIIRLCQLLGIQTLQMQDYEADDLLATLAEKGKKDHQVYVLSGDKDLMQVVGKNVTAIRPQHGVSETAILDREGVKALFGVYPEQIPDYLAIVGDTSDNIPGVKGIGEKGAVELLGKYPTLEAVYEHLDEIGGAKQKKLIESRETAFLSLTLARAKNDLDIDEKMLDLPFSLESLAGKTEARELFQHYQLNALVQDLDKMASKAAETPAPGSLFTEEAPKAPVQGFTGNYRLILKTAELKEFIRKAEAAGTVSIDTETTSTAAYSAGLVGVSMSLEAGSGVFLPAEYPAGQEYTEQELIALLKPLLENPEVKKIGQNVKFEVEVFSARGIELRGIGFDTMLAAYLINPTRAKINLESLVQEYLGLAKGTYTDLIKSAGKLARTLFDVPVEALCTYAASDADAALRLYPVFSKEIGSLGLSDVLYRMEQPLLEVLAEMEANGVRLDLEALKKLSAELSTKIAELEESIYRLAGKEFNLNSPAQLARLLFEEMGIPPVKKTEGGKASTDEEVLTQLAAEYEMPAKIIEYRGLTKLKNTYADALPQLVDPETRRVHTSFNQTITATGRLSSSDPNLQNIPIRDEIGQTIREAFVPEPGWVMVSADYSQIELRVLAHFCRDEALQSAFREGRDIHRHTAALVFGVSEAEVTDEMRRRAKGVNFGIIYGLQAFGLSRQLGIAMGEARDFIENYFRSFPKVRGFVEEVLHEARDTGMVKTLSGRYRPFPDLAGKPVKDSAHLSGSQRMALNSKIQGSAADIIKAAMIELRRRMKAEGLRARLLLQIHDELVLEVPPEEVEKVESLLKSVMESAWELGVPLIAEVGQGKNWREAH